MGPSRPRSTVLTEAEEAIIVEFRRRTLLPLDYVLGCLRESIPKLSRSALHRCLVRHGISRLPKDEENASSTSPRPRSVRSTSTRASCAWPRAKPSYSWPSIACPSSPTSSSTRPPTRSPGPLSCVGDRGVPISGPHGADRQRHPFADQPRYRSARPRDLQGHAFDRVCRSTASSTG